MILAVVPARGGSKRLPRKNVMPFGGKPLLVWSVETALALPGVGACLVSTEDAEIAAVARQSGATVIDRPAELATDNASIIDVLIHATEAVKSRGVRPDGVLLLQPTNPLRPRGMMMRAIDRFMSEPCDSLMGVSGRPLKLGTIENGYFLPSYEAGAQSRLMPLAFYENGSVYLTKTDTLLAERSLFGKRILAFDTERPFDEVDIDEPVDLLVGEAILAAVGNQLSA
jgi:N-acylneuraminate cytidylyltransferase